ncbi:MAG: DUF4147 domain-containing protein [Candidatus Heimdallarchaeota archaeon]|nr:DUF4147 domain-containing protein [Candidatus Heimdallarchaeota archaeon]
MDNDRKVSQKEQKLDPSIYPIIGCIKEALSQSRVDKLLNFKSEIIDDSNTIGISIGKLASLMAETFAEQINLHIPIYVFQARTYETSSGEKFSQLSLLNHPYPTESTSRSIKNALDEINHDIKNIYFLVSGGGSAVFALPEEKLTLEVYVHIIKTAVDGGSTIEELNQIRSVIDQLKGGKLLKKFPNAKFHCYLISDVKRDDPKIIASGPVFPGLSLSLQTRSQLEIIASKLGIKDIIDGLISQYDNWTKSQDTGNVELKQIISQTFFAERLMIRLQTIGYTVSMSKTDLTLELTEIPKAIDFELSQLKERQAMIWIGEPIISTLTQEHSGEGGRVSSLVVLMSRYLKAFPNTYFVGFATDGQDGTSKDNFFFISQKAGIVQNDLEIINSGVSGEHLRKAGLSYRFKSTATNFSDIFMAIRPL